MLFIEKILRRQEIGAGLCCGWAREPGRGWANGYRQPQWANFFVDQGEETAPVSP